MINPYKRIKELEEDNELMQEMLMNSVPADIKAQQVIENIINRGIEWFDYKKMEYADKVTYKQDAKSILLNRTFLNEYNKYIEDLVTHIAKEAPIETIEHLRTGIVTLESFLERLQEVEAPDEEDSDDEIHDAI